MAGLFYLVLESLGMLPKSDRTLSGVGGRQRFHRMGDPKVGLLIPDMADHLQKTSDIAT